jgi:hypothetical protein
MNLSDLTLYAGTKWSWSEAPTGYLPPNYSLKIYLKLKNGAAIELPSTPDGTVGFDFEVLPETTNITAGTYTFQAQAFDVDGVMYFVEAGTIAVLPNLSVADDTREYWEQVADEAKAAYKTLAGQVAQSITLSNGQTITFANRAELLKIINNAEIKAGIKSSKRRTFAKFINPSNYE